ncbi:hypothetical protein NCU03518 [Neurospora crassa OR74A]|uniref:Uncharacterized protein n=1 Tax=Neurospora crassa (strain ATCC 24698 / 74-OR23-1A / CBS 708.71 / DSM 1257 / FGSC 987) TaxID=367110 RepID=Q7RW86_NEUCR|nr:hypothetical protein NCU03518 [Neurospora crassa OR74A]EAA26638.2 hypothetical protein NCU03518 [Neurospora crassa OR74A]|eukprot:XP_955874.2 hypothetical protein NCU03518 [Neurospora crassa OR74A]
MDNDTPPPIPPRPPGWVSSPLSSPGSGPVPSSPQPQSVDNETPPPPLPPRRPTNEEQPPPPPVLERQSRPYSYVPPASRESSGLSPPPLPPRVTRRPVPQREPQPQPQPQPQSSSPQFEPFRPQQFQEPKVDVNPPSPFQSQAGNQTTSAEFGGFRGHYTPYQPQQTFPPPPPPRPPPTSSSSSSSSPQPSIPYEKWTPLFQPTGSPNPIFISLMKSFFEVLVAQQTPEMRPADGGGMAVNGQMKLLLSPEKCSEFLDVQGFAVEHNPWKLNKTPWSSLPAMSLPGLPDPFAGVTPLDKADWEFRLILQAFGIHHLPIPRPRPRPRPSSRPSAPPNPTNPLIPSWFTNLFTTSSTEIPESMRVLGIGQTPFLTEQGFIKYMALETAGEPDRGFEGVNTALRYYAGCSAGQGEQWGESGGRGGIGEAGGGGGIKRWMEKLGPIPRDMFPLSCPREIQMAVDVGQAKHRRLCEEAVAGSRAYCDMAAEGRRHAVELTGDYRTVRVDEWGNRIW